MTAFVPQTDPRANYLAHKAEIDKAIATVLVNGRYILGQEVEAFENEFARYIRVPFGIGVGSGTEALHIGLRACGIGPGDGVVTVSHTAVATVAAIELCGATPVLVDIDPKTFAIDPNCVEDAIKRVEQPKIRAIIAVHLYGHPAEMENLRQIADQYGLTLLEDCAQAHGAAYKGKKVGAWGDVAAFSFYPTKNLGAVGDGGMIVTDSNHLADRARTLREYGWRERFVSECRGMNSRLDELQAAVLRIKLWTLDEENERRRNLAKLYTDNLQGLSLKTPACVGDVQHAYHQYVIRSIRRDDLRRFLDERRVGTAIHYPVPVHLQPAYRGRVPTLGELPHTGAAVSEILSLPMYSELSLDVAAGVAQAIKLWEVSEGVETRD